MKPRFLMLLTAVTLFAALAIPVRLRAQGKPEHNSNHNHHHYKLIDLGTFGGPQSAVVGFSQIINSQGTIVAGADTATPDPNYPNCFVGAGYEDCFVQHAFKWQNGVRTDLGALPGGPSSFPNEINDSGLIAGFSQNNQIDPLTGLPEIDAVLWRTGKIINLGTLGGSFSGASAINNGGQVAGFALNAIPDPFSIYDFLFLGSSNGTQTRAFLWRKGVMQDLGTLGGPDAFAVYVNDRGQVAGLSYTSGIPTSSGVPQLDPFLWDSGTMMDIGSFGGTSGFVNALNNRGQVVGQLNLAGDLTFHPFLWSNGMLTDLGTFGGDNGASNWLNDAGDIVGQADFPGGQTHAFLWKNNVMTDLGTLPGDACSFALGINPRGQVVGGSAPCDFSIQHGFLWENGAIYNLNDLIHPASDLLLRFPNFINDRGEIGGTGILPNGDLRAFLLTPCDENHPGVEGCDYGLVDATALPQTSGPPSRLAQTDQQFQLSKARFPFRNHILGRTLAKRGIAGEAATGQPRSQNTASPQSPIVMLQPASLNFGTVIYGRSSTMTTKLTNVGSSLLTISAINIGGTGASAFSQTNTCGGMVGVGGSCIIKVTFKPQGIYLQKFSARVRVVDNASGSPQHVPLSGTGSPNCNFSCSQGKCPFPICHCGGLGFCQPGGPLPKESSLDLLDDPKSRPACSNATQSFRLAAPN